MVHEIIIADADAVAATEKLWPTNYSARNAIIFASSHLGTLFFNDRQVPVILLPTEQYSVDSGYQLE
ncbi:unnamed protein product [Enterobius vermicularis]|uniref:POR_N domain-containing protein n=1 Tax=Enterobius vermicularis TaxID=51028 RepID=A0A0N4VN73_ENTVE|nr:unnamed protein product [Enterobius vermicularis]